MIIANIEPLMNEIKKSKEKSLIEMDVSMCFVFSVIEKYINEMKKVEVSMETIEERLDNEVYEVYPNYDLAYDRLGSIFDDLIIALKKLEEDPA